MNFGIIEYLYHDTVRFVKALFTKEYLKADPEVAKKRMEICQACPLINKEGRLFGYTQPRCSICGCYLNGKTKLNFEICPDKPPRWMDSGKFSRDF